MSEKINLEEIIRDTIVDTLSPKLQNPGQALGIANRMIEKDWYVKAAMLEFGKQLLKLAYENAKIKEHRPDWEDDRRYYEVSEKSILDTIKQVE